MMTPKAEPPIPREELNLESFSEEERLRLSELMLEEAFIDAPTRRAQITAACIFLRDPEDPLRFTYLATGVFLGGLTAGVVTSQERKASRPTRAPDRPGSFSPEISAWIAGQVAERFQWNNPISYPELLDVLQYHFRIVISADTLRHRIRNIDSVKSLLGIPTEAERVAVDCATLAEWNADLGRRIAGVPRQFVFNVDETGCSNFSDKRETTVLVPSTYEARSVRIPVDRHAKRSTLTTCIAADGDRARPFDIVEHHTAKMELSYYGYNASNVTIATEANGFLTSRLFNIWAERVFFSAIEERRGEVNYTGKVVLLMDGLGAHHTEKFLQDCRDPDIDVVFLVPHISDQTQLLDLITFAVLKQCYSSSRFSRLTTAQSNKLVRILGAWFAANAPHYNVEAFMNAGLIPVEHGGVFCLSVHPEHARRLRGWPAAGAAIPPAPLPPNALKRIPLADGRQEPQ
jgi:hypothetical protein